MVHITFDYEPESKSVTNIKVTDLVVSTPTTEKRQKSVSKPTKTMVNFVELRGGSLKLTDAALTALNVGVGDRLCLRFNNGPIIATPEALGETGGGNLITKSLTLTCKGKVGEELSRYGTQFSYHLDSPGYLVLNGDKQVDTKIEEIKSEEIDEVNFKPTIVDGKEVEFDFGI